MTMPPRRTYRRVLRPLVGGAVLLMLSLPSIGWAAPERLRLAEQYQVEGDTLYNNGRYLEAGRAWSRILELLEESEQNRAERENALLIALEAYGRPYEGYQLGAVSGKPSERVILGLREGVERYDEYLAAFDRVHGEAFLSPAVLEAGQRISAWYAEATRGAPELESKPPKPTSGPLDPEILGCDRAFNRCYQRGVPLIIAGSVTLAAGLGTTSMIIIGALRMTDARGENPARRDRVGEGLVIGGSVATGALLIAGGTMLGLGLSRRSRRLAWAPTLGPEGVGWTFAGRF